MVSYRRPGPLVRRKRVGFRSGMWLHQVSSIAGQEPWHDRSMCKPGGECDYDTSAPRPIAFDGVPNPGTDVCIAGLDFQSDEGKSTYITNVEEPSGNLRGAMLAVESGPLTSFSELDHHYLTGRDAKVGSGLWGCPELEEADVHSVDTIDSGGDEIDIEFKEINRILMEEGPKSEVLESLDAVESSPVLLLSQDSLQPGATLPTQQLIDEDMTFLSSSQEEEVEDIDGEPFMFFPSSAQEALPSEYLNGHHFLPISGPELQGTELGGEILESRFVSSPCLLITPSDAEEDGDENINFLDTSCSLGDSTSIDFLDIDHNRPTQTDGSVLASEANFVGSMPALDGAGMVYPKSTNISVQGKVAPHPNVVDLTEDSNDEEDIFEVPVNYDQVAAYGKRRLPGALESEKRKRPNIPGGSTEIWGSDGYDFKALTSRCTTSTISSSVPDLSIPTFSVSKKPESWIYSKQEPNFSGSSHVSSHDSSGSFINHSLNLVGGRSVPLVKPHRGPIGERRNSLQSCSSYDPNGKRTLPVPMVCLPTSLRSMYGGQPDEDFPSRALDGSAAKLMKEGFLAGTSKEEASPADGLLSVPLLKHQRLALAWMGNREKGLSPQGGPQGGILADDQGLGKTISTISLILMARAPILKNPFEVVDSAKPEAFIVDLGDDAGDNDELQIVGITPNDEKLGVRSPETAASSAVTGLAPEQTGGDLKLRSSSRRPAAGSLVVCPTSVLRQWAHEIKEKVTDKACLSLLIYHGSSRTRDPAELAKYDVVLTTYSIVSMEVPKQPLPDEKDGDKKNSGESDFPAPFRVAKAKNKKTPDNGKKKRGNGKGRLVEGENGSVDSGPLARVNWFRVILDEAQSIKNARTQVARAAWGLRAKRRWCLSGTPIQNSVDDLYSYFRFLRYAPYDAYKIFRERIKDPVSRNPGEGYKVLQALLKPVMLRRTKGCLIDGKPIVNLPPRVVTLKQAEFNDEERAFYEALENESRKQFQDYAAAGTLQSNYVNILWMLLRLRQACDHPLLVKGHKSQNAQKAVLDSARRLPADERMHLITVLEANRSICVICNDLPDEAVVCICAHIFCRQCISEQLATGDDTCCPIPKCRKSLNASLVFTLASLKNCDSGPGSSTGGSLCLEEIQEEMCNNGEDVGWKSSSKIDAVIETLSALPEVSMVVDNRKVVAQKRKDVEDVKLNDTPGFRTMKEEPGSNELGSVVKCEPVMFARHDPDNMAEMAGYSSCVGVEQQELGPMDGASNTEIQTTNAAAVVNGVMHEFISTDPASLKKPLIRQTVTSTEKAIVFSQWTSMLDLLEVRLKQAKFNYRRLDGTMSVLARDRAVSEFKTLPEVTVIIMSLKAASLGLNMVAASHVLLLDVWWNPTTEDQAIDRAHRIGQTRTVNVSRFTVKNTIEDRILALQEKKRRMVASAFGESEGMGQNTKLSHDDMSYLFQTQ